MASKDYKDVYRELLVLERFSLRCPGGRLCTVLHVIPDRNKLADPTSSISATTFDFELFSLSAPFPHPHKLLLCHENGFLPDRWIW
jgi:hypothetical protein